MHLDRPRQAAHHSPSFDKSGMIASQARTTPG